MSDKYAIMEAMADQLEQYITDHYPMLTYRAKKMFGGMGYFIDDKMFAAYYGKDGGFALKLDQVEREDLLTLPATKPGMHKPYLILSDTIMTDTSAFQEWLSKSIEYTMSLVVKPKK